jgi:hypothetical protein
MISGRSPGPRYSALIGIAVTSPYRDRASDQPTPFA